MATLTIEQNGLTFTFYAQRTLGVTLRMGDFAKLVEPRFANPDYQNVANYIMLCSAYTVNITGDGALAVFWAQYGKQSAAAIWEGAAVMLFEDDLNAWWSAYDAVRSKPESADFLDESKTPLATP